MNIFGYNGRPMGKWSIPSFNTWQPNGQTLEEYIQANTGNGASVGQLRQRFWEERNAAVEAARQELDGMRSADSFGDLLLNTDTQNASAVIQVQKSLDQWSQLESISKNGGQILGYDLETFGDTRFGRRGQFGITEIGLNLMTVENNGLYSQGGHSFAIGMSEDEAKYAYDVLNKYQTKGWKSLSKVEAVTMQRLSMYGGVVQPNGVNGGFDSVFRRITEDSLSADGRFIGTWEVRLDGLSPADMSPARIAAGIELQRQLYEAGATSESVLSKVIPFIEEKRVGGASLAAANSSFDTVTLSRYTGGQYADAINSIARETTDLVYAQRAIGDAQTISVAALQKSIHGVRGGGAPVQALIATMGYGEKEIHHGLGDTSQQNRILVSPDFAKGESISSYLLRHTQQTPDGRVLIDTKGKQIIKQYDAKNTVFLINHGWLDKRNGTDIATIRIGDNVETTQNYTISGEYWSLDLDKTGEVEDGYRLTLVSQADDGVSISKRFATKEDAASFLRENADWFTIDEIDDKVIADQVKYKYQDRGRREFERAFDPASVFVDEKGMATGGYAQLEKFLEWNEKYQGYDATPEGFLKFVEAGRAASPDDFATNKLNQAQGFLGAQQKIAEESILLTQIKRIVDNKYGETTVENNMQKTIAARRAYEEAMEILSVYKSASDIAEHQNLTMGDIYGVDIRNADGTISRINTRTIHTATNNVSTIFGRMTKDEMVAAINDLASEERKILTPEKGAELSQLIREVSIETGGDRAKREAFEKYLGTESSYQLYIDIAAAIAESNQRYTQGTFAEKRAARQAAEPKFTLISGASDVDGSFSARIHDYMYARYVTEADGDVDLNAFLERNRGIAAQIADNSHRSIAELPGVQIFGGKVGDPQKFKDQLRILTDGLGYGDDIIVRTQGSNGNIYTANIIENMFFNTPKPGKKGYGITVEEGIHSVIVRPNSEGSAFILLTNDRNYGHLMDDLSKVHAADIATYKSITGSALAQHAAIYELPAIQRLPVDLEISDAMKGLMGKDIAEIVALKQSESSEKFLIPRLNIYKDEKTNQVKMYVNKGVWDFHSSWQMTGGNALEQVANSRAGEFSDITRYLRRQQNKKLQDLSGSASYRGLWEDGRIVRRPNYTPGDYLFAYRMQMTNELRQLFEFGLTNDDGIQRNALDLLVDEYGSALGMYRGKRSALEYRQDVVSKTHFKEFFAKNLFVGTIGDDYTFGGQISDYINGNNTERVNISGRNIFSLIQDTVNRDTTSSLFDSSVARALGRIDAVARENEIFQVLSSTAMEKGQVSLGLAAGEFNVNAFLYSTMRPTYLQQNLGRMFDPTKEWDSSLFETWSAPFIESIYKSPDKVLRTIVGSPEVTAKEGMAKKLLGTVIPDYDRQVRHVMTGFKQMNDNDLQLRYQLMRDKSTSLARDVGISEDMYNKALDFLREDMLSLHEGKWFLDPRIAEQKVVTTPDAKKIKLFNTKLADAQRTGEVIQQLVDSGVTITKDTIVGYTSTGEAIYAGDNIDAMLRDFNIDDLFDITETQTEEGSIKYSYAFKQGSDGITRIIPNAPDIRDHKLMLNGSEKATAHAISVDSFMKYMGDSVRSREEAIGILSKMFAQVSDGAGVIGYLNLKKHGNLNAIDSPWRIITSEYVAQGQGQLLVDYLNRQIDANKKGFENIGKFVFEGGEIRSNTGRAFNPVSFLLSVTNDIRENSTMVFGDRGSISHRINEIINAKIDYTREHGITYGAIEFMNQNEHVSDGIFLDERIKQGIRQRANALKSGEQWDEDWVKSLTEQARNYTGERLQENTSQYDNINRIFNFHNRNISVKKIQSRNKRYNMEKSLHGIVESLVYYEAPDAFDVHSKNIVSIDFQKLMNAGILPEQGVSVNSLQSSLFFTDGKPSDALQRLAAQQQKDFGPIHSSYSNSLYIDLGSYSIKSRGGDENIHGFLIPIQNVITDADETMFQSQQRRTAALLARLQEVIENPADKKGRVRSIDEINKELDSLVREYYRESMGELAVSNKDSDFYRAIQRVFMPNSGGVLAGQEVAPLIYDEETNEELQRLLKRRRELEVSIAAKDGDVAKSIAEIQRLDDVYTKIKAINEGTAEKIAKGKVLPFAQLKGTSLEHVVEEVIGKDTVYGYVAAASKKTFESQGLDFGQFGMDIIADVEQKGNLVPEKFITTAKSYRQSIMQEIEKTKGEGILDGLTIRNEDTIMYDINEWTKVKYGKTIAEFNTKGLNEAMAEAGDKKGEIKRLQGMFEGVAEKYMKEIGLVGELIRYPTFRSQLASKYILSDFIEGEQIMLFNPVASSVTNVDFDGDLMYSIFQFNGWSGLLSQNAQRLQNNVYVSGFDNVRSLLAELVKDGGAYSYEDINDLTSQMASILKKMNRTKYNELMAEYAKSAGLKSSVDVKGAHEFAFNTSSAIRRAFIEWDYDTLSLYRYNTLMNPQFQKASIAPVLRKENIGYISTTNFSARTMLEGMEKRYRNSGNIKTADEVANILSTVSTPEYAKGGLFDMAEQTGIDTKHVWDAMTTAETAKYSSGIHLLFGRNALPLNQGGAVDTSKLLSRQRLAVSNIVSALYNSVFTDTNKGVIDNRRNNIQMIVEQIMTAKADLQAGKITDWTKYEFDGNDYFAKRGILALLRMQELDLPNNLKNVKSLFASALSKGYDNAFGDLDQAAEIVSSELFETWKMVQKAGDVEEVAKLFDGTYYESFIRFLDTSMSDRSLQLTQGNLLVMPMSLRSIAESEHSGNNLVFALKESRYTDKEAIASFDVYEADESTRTLRRVNANDYSDVIPKISKRQMKIQDDGTIVFSARDNQALNEMLGLGEYAERGGYFSQMRRITIGPQAMQRDAVLAAQAFDQMSPLKTFRGLNDIVLGSNSKAITQQEVFNNIKYLQDASLEVQARFGQRQYDTLIQLFAPSGVDIADVASRTSNLIDTYNYARSINQVKGSISSNELLTQINNDIASHPERYLNSSGQFVGTFDAILRQKMIDDRIFVGNDKLDELLKTVSSLGDNFDVRSYTDELLSLREGLYDVKKEREVLSSRYRKLFADNPLGQTEVVKKAQESFPSTLSGFEESLSSLNKARITEAQERIYKMFSSVEQRNAVFGWSEALSPDSQKVGFGMHIGREFGSLTATEAHIIIADAQLVVDDVMSSDSTKDAAAQTAERLSKYMKTALMASESTMRFSQVNSDLLDEALKEVDTLRNHAIIETKGTEWTEAAEAAAKVRTKSKTLSGHFMEQARSFADNMGITKKHVGVALAGMAALGIVNNLLHNQKTDSPLMPAHKPNGNGSPNIDGYYPESPQGSAPPSVRANTGGKTVYQSNGLNFRVSARTQRSGDARQQAAQISSITGGGTNISVQQDTSRVTDNWLSNKFAELI